MTGYSPAIAFAAIVLALLLGVVVTARAAVVAALTAHRPGARR